MTGVKSKFRSKTVWGGVIAGVAIVAGFFGVDITAADQSEIGSLVGQAFDVWDRIVALAGVALAIYGRITATKKLS